MPATFRFPDRRVDLWSPVAIGEQLMRFRAATWYVGVGRLKRDATIEQARENLSAIQAELGRQYPDTDRQIGVALQPLKDAAIGNVTSSLWLLFGGVSILRDTAGSGRTPLNPVPPQRQRDALKLIEAGIFSADDFRFHPAFLRKLSTDAERKVANLANRVVARSPGDADFED